MSPERAARVQRLDDVIRARPSEGGSHGPRVRGAVTAALVSLATFAASLSGIAAAAPDAANTDAPVRARLDAFASVKDEIDVLVVGSSHSLRGISPDALDARLAERGLALRTFNLAYLGMRPIEADRNLRRALALRPARLRYVLIELAPVTGAGRNLATWRSIGWHDLAATRRELEAVWATDRPPVEAWRLSEPHLRAFGAHAFRIGLGPEAFTTVFGNDEKLHRRAVRRTAERRGFDSIDEELNRAWWRDAHERFVRSSDEIDDHGARGDAPGPSRTEAEALREQVAAVRAAGAEPVYVVLPRLAPGPVAADPAAIGARVLRFDRPDAIPELADRRHWFDGTHLLESGATILSRLLADRLADLPGARGDVPGPQRVPR